MVKIFSSEMINLQFTSTLSFAIGSLRLSIPAIIDTGCNFTVIAVQDFVENIKAQKAFERLLIEKSRVDSSRYNWANGMYIDHESKPLYSELPGNRDIRYSMSVRNVCVDSCMLGDCTVRFAVYGARTLIGMDLLQVFDSEIVKTGNILTFNGYLRDDFRKTVETLNEYPSDISDEHVELWVRSATKTVSENDNSSKLTLQSINRMSLH